MDSMSDVLALVPKRMFSVDAEAVCRQGRFDRKQGRFDRKYIVSRKPTMHRKTKIWRMSE